MSTLSQFDSLLAEVQRMREEHLRLQEENQRLKSLVSSAPAPAPEPAAEPLPAPAPAPVGSKHVWTSDDQNRRIVAIQLEHGRVLQVKDVTCSLRESMKRYYETLEEWRSSLPEGGQVQTESEKSELQKRLAQPFPKESSDCEALNIFFDRWNIRDYSLEVNSPAENLEFEERQFKKMQKIVAEIQVSDLQDDDAARVSTRLLEHLSHYFKKILRRQAFLRTLDPSERNKRPVLTKHRGTAHLYAFVEGIRASITISGASDFIYCNGRKGRTFAELGIDLKEDGTPLFELWYRNKIYPL